MRTQIVVFLFCLVAFDAHAMPPQWPVTKRRAVITSLDKPDAKADGKFYIQVQCVGQNGKPTTDHELTEGWYRLEFAAQAKILGITRSQRKKELTFDDLRVGQSLRFSGYCVGGLVHYLKECKIFLP